MLRILYIVILYYILYTYLTVYQNRDIYIIKQIVNKMSKYPMTLRSHTDDQMTNLKLKEHGETEAVKTLLRSR